MLFMQLTRGCGGSWRYSAEVQLGIIGIAIETKAIVGDDLNKREHVDGKKKGSKHRVLGLALVDWCRGGTGVSDGEKLFPVGET